MLLHQNSTVEALTPLPPFSSFRVPMAEHDVFDEGARAAFETFVREMRPKVEGRLAAVFEVREREAAAHGRDVAVMVAALRALTLRGGKRLRAALALAAFRATGGDGDEAPAIDVGVALELLQTYLLVHDDWMDGDLVRRGGPSVHAMLREHFGANERGDASAILAGDFASALAQEVVSSLATSPTRALAVVRRFADIQRDAVYGQQLDIAGRESDVEAMHALKTGSYTVRGPLLLGAALAGAGAKAEATLARYAAPLGVAFQLRDDVLGTFGDPAQTGKPFGNDLRAGKRTALVVEGERRLDDRGRAVLARALGKVDATADEIAAATDALAGCGARGAVESRIDSLLASACGELTGDELTAEGSRLLRGASLSLTARAS